MKFSEVKCFGMGCTRLSVTADQEDVNHDQEDFEDDQKVVGDDQEAIDDDQAGQPGGR